MSNLSPEAGTLNHAESTMTLNRAVCMMRVARMLLACRRCADALELYERSLPVLSTYLHADDEHLAKAKAVVACLKAISGGKTEVVHLGEEVLELRGQQHATDKPEELRVAAVVQWFLRCRNETAHGGHCGQMETMMEAAAAIEGRVEHRAQGG